MLDSVSSVDSCCFETVPGTERLSREIIAQKRWESIGCPPEVTTVILPTKLGSSIQVQVGYHATIVLNDMSDCFVGCTPQLSRIMGCYRSDVIGVSVRDFFFTPNISAKYSQFLAEVVSNSPEPNIDSRQVGSRGFLNQEDMMTVLWSGTPARLGGVPVMIFLVCPVSPSLVQHLDLPVVLKMLDKQCAESVQCCQSKLLSFFTEEYGYFANVDMVHYSSFLSKDFLPMNLSDGARIVMHKVGQNVLPADIVMEALVSSSSEQSSDAQSHCGEVSTYDSGSMNSDSSIRDSREAFESLLYYLTPGMVLRVGNFACGVATMNHALVVTQDPPITNQAKPNRVPKLRLAVQYIGDDVQLRGVFPKDVHISKVLQIVNRNDVKKLLSLQLADPEGEVVRRVNSNVRRRSKAKRLRDSRA